MARAEQSVQVVGDAIHKEKIVSGSQMQCFLKERPLNVKRFYRNMRSIVMIKLYVL